MQNALNLFLIVILVLTQAYVQDVKMIITL